MRKSANRVLVLEDSLRFDPATMLTLTGLGYRAEAETCPARAIRKMITGNYDFLLTGYRMRGLNGFQVACFLRAMGSFAPIILLVDGTESICGEDLPSYGIAGVLKKPLRFAEFGGALSEILRILEN